jgi:hypothetical protein
MARRERFCDMWDASRGIDYMFEKMRESVGHGTHMHSQGYACCVQSRHAKSMRYRGAQNLLRRVPGTPIRATRNVGCVEHDRETRGCGWRVNTGGKYSLSTVRR